MLAEKFAEPQCWASGLESNEPDSAFELFTEVVQQKISDSSKTKIIKASNKTVFKKPWMTHEILQLRNEREKFRKLLKIHPFDQKVEQNYKKFRNAV